MTDIVPASSQEIALVNEAGVPIGLEDFGATDQVMPMLKIDHKAQPAPVFEHSLSNMQFPEITVVILGLIKQRVLWPGKISNDKKPPLCRSYDNDTGYPYQFVPPEDNPNAGPDQEFPWESAGFQNNGTKALPCASCKLKNWGTHPTRDAPWCTEQHCFALMIPYDDGSFAPALFQVQRSGLRASRKYLSDFKNSGRPLFTVYTKLSLEARMMQGNPYGVIEFTNVGEVNSEHFQSFAQNFMQIRNYLHTPRSIDETQDADEVAVEVGTPAPAPAPAAPQPASAPAAPQPAAPAAPAAPQPPAPAAPAAPQPAPAPAPAPALPFSGSPAAPVDPAQPGVGGQPTPAAPVGPAPAPVPAQPVPAQPVAAQPAAPQYDSDEVPF